jgi:hypothetical protein
MRVMTGSDVKWIPEVAEMARRLYEDAKSDSTGAARVWAKRIWRLGTDPRLANRWKLLPHNKVAELFEAACSAAVGTTTWQEICEEVDRRNRLAEELRRMIPFFPPDKKWMVSDVAWIIEGTAKKLVDYNGPWVVKKNKLDRWTRGYVLDLSESFCRTLGDPHDKFVAEIATVARELQKPLAESVVRSWRTYNRKQIAKN